MIVKWLIPLLLSQQIVAKDSLIVGGIFDDDYAEDIILKNAIKSLNSSNFQFLSKRVSKLNVFDVFKSTCNFFENKARVVFGPNSIESVSTVQELCANKSIPHITAGWMYNPKYSTNLLNFYPHSDYLSKAYQDIVKLWGWKSFTVFFDSNISFLEMVELISEGKKLGIIVSVKKLDHEEKGNYKPSFKEVLLSGETNFVINCQLEILENVLTQAQQVGILTKHYNCFITNLDFQSINSKPFMHSLANITTLRLFNLNTLAKNHIFSSVNQIRTKTVLLVDAINILDTVLKQYSNSTSDTEIINCKSANTFNYGEAISRQIRHRRYNGFTGSIEFDGNGQRKYFNLDIVELQEKGFRTIGTWNPSQGLSIVNTRLASVIDDFDTLRNRSFTVITYLNDPYCMFKETPKYLHGNNRFEGFCIDLIKKLSEMEGFTYTIILRDDKSNGAKDPKTGKWNGIIGDIIDNKADLAISDLTITSEREEAVDFTSSFMYLGISLLAQAPSKAPPKFFSFADPFHFDTWIGLGVAYVLVTLSFTILGRMCHKEWINPYYCLQKPKYLINQFTFKNSVWFSTGALMQQGTNIAPRATSTRMMAGIWWFFVLIMVSSYTASLAAFLTTKTPMIFFDNLKDFMTTYKEYNFKLGAKANGSTASFFKVHKDPLYNNVGNYLKNHPQNMVTENGIGVMRAKNERYAFLMESTSIDYEVQRHCDLQQYGNLLDEKAYGIAMRKNSPYRKRLSTAILKLEASGQIDDLKRKWWEEKQRGWKCKTAKDKDGAASPLELENLVGVFYVTFFGSILSIVVVFFEILIYTRKNKISFKDHLKKAFK